MLVLSRKINESIIINNNIVVTVIGIVDNKIKIGIEAPKDIRIMRQEIANQVAKNK